MLIPQYVYLFLSSSLPLPLPHYPYSVTPPTVEITPASVTATAGESVTFTCTVTRSEGDTDQPAIVWTGPVNINTDSDITEGTTTQDPENSSTYTRTLEFTTVLTSHAENYNCVGSTSAGTGMETAMLTVESECTELFTLCMPTQNGQTIISQCDGFDHPLPVQSVFHTNMSKFLIIDDLLYWPSGLGLGFHVVMARVDGL